MFGLLDESSIACNPRLLSGVSRRLNTAAPPPQKNKQKQQEAADDEDAATTELGAVGAKPFILKLKEDLGVDGLVRDFCFLGGCVVACVLNAPCPIPPPPPPSSSP